MPISFKKKVKAIRISIKQIKFSDAGLLITAHPPLRSPSCTLPLMLSTKNTGTLSFLSMTHTSTVKLWVCMDFVKDTWEKSLSSKQFLNLYASRFIGQQFSLAFVILGCLQMYWTLIFTKICIKWSEWHRFNLNIRDPRSCVVVNAELTCISK